MNHRPLSRCLLLALLCSTPAFGQTPEPLRLDGVGPAGTRSSVTESYASFKFIVHNLGPTPRDARVVIHYPEQEGVQYARDVWVPPMSSLTSWVPVGPAPPQSAEIGREIRMLLYDRTGGGMRLVLPPTEERTRGRAILYRKREPTVTIIRSPDSVDPRDPNNAESVHFSNVVRNTLELPERAGYINVPMLPPTPETFDGIDVVIFAGTWLDGDPVGRAALRQWVAAGGALWVMLDQIKPDAVASLLGDDADVTVIDRVGLTRVELKRANGDAGWGPRDEERPVDLVRVVPSATDRVTHTVDGWPAAFTRRVGRGKVLFTTLGPRGWYRERVASDQRQQPPKGRNPVPAGDPKVPPSRSITTQIENPLVGDLAGILYPSPEPDPLPPDVFRPLITDEIGYKVVSRTSVALVLGGFVAALLAVGLGLRKSRRPEVFGWGVPAVAAVAAVVLVFAGERSRRVVPPTVAVVQLVSPVAGTGESAASGLFAVYNPSSGPAAVGSDDGSTLALDTEGLEGQPRRRVQLDTGRWKWDGLELPAGVRTGTFRAVTRSGRVTAVARFGPDGLSGKLDAEGYTNVGDAIALTTSREPAAVRINADGTFATGPADALPPGQYVAGAVLSDRQQRRQAVHQQLLTGKVWPRYLDDRNLLLAWADTPAVPFLRAEGARVAGAALLAIPMEFERTPPGTRVVVPAALVPYRRLIDHVDAPVTRNGTFAASQVVRFTLPPSVLPLKVEKITFTARVTTPFRKFNVAGVDGSKKTPMFDAVGPTDPIRVELSGAGVVQPDARGGVVIQVDVGAPAGGPPDTPWKIDAMGLEVVGTTGP